MQPLKWLAVLAVALAASDFGAAHQHSSVATTKSVSTHHPTATPSHSHHHHHNHHHHSHHHNGTASGHHHSPHHSTTHHHTTTKKGSKKISSKHHTVLAHHTTIKKGSEHTSSKHIVSSHHTVQHHEKAYQAHHEAHHSSAKKHTTVHHGESHKKATHKTTTSKHHTTKTHHHAAPTTTKKETPRHTTSSKHANGLFVDAFSESNPSSTTTAKEADATPDTNENDAVPTDDSATTTSDPAVVASPNADAAVPTIADPNTAGTDATVTVDNLASGDAGTASVSNKTIGISVGAAVGCIAAVGLAGMMVYKRQTRRRFEDSIGGGNNMDETPQTHWRPTSFMAAVTSVVARLPRDRNSSSSRGSGGFAASVLGSLRRVGSGRSNRSSSGSEMSHHSQESHTSFGYAVSGPVPELTRVDDLGFHDVDLRATR